MEKEFKSVLELTHEQLAKASDILYGGPKGSPESEARLKEHIDSWDKAFTENPALFKFLVIAVLNIPDEVLVKYNIKSMVLSLAAIAYTFGQASMTDPSLKEVPPITTKVQ